MAKKVTLTEFNEADLIAAVKKVAAETPYRVVGYVYAQADGSQTVVITLKASVDAQDKQQTPVLAEAVVRQVQLEKTLETHYGAFEVEEDADIPLNGDEPTAVEEQLAFQDAFAQAAHEETMRELTAENAATLLQTGVKAPATEKVVHQPQGNKFYDDAVLKRYFGGVGIGLPEEEAEAENEKEDN